jgi:uroporphyrinogen-III decarboxylase
METMTHSQRIQRAIACKPVDRTAYTNFSTQMLGRYANPEFCTGDMYTRPEWAIEQAIKGAQQMGGETIPSYTYGPLFAADITGTYYLTPGKDLPATDTFHAIETNPMQDEHIEFILKNGVQAWFDQYVMPAWPDWAEEGAAKGGEIAALMAQKVAEAGESWYDFPIPDYMGPMFYGMARGFQETLIDAFTEPETTRKIVDMLNEWNIAYTAGFYEMMGIPLQAVCPALARMDDNTLSPEIFDSVFWPALQRCIRYAEENDVPLIAHLDGKWENMLSRHIHQFTAQKTVIQLDGFSDSFSLAEAFVANDICMMGDVPPMTLIHKDGQRTYDHVIRLKQLFGDHLILNAGCQAPPDTTDEALRAFVEAARTSHF